MDLARLRRIDDARWSVPLAPGDRRAPVLLYGNAPLLASMDDKVLEQLTTVARLPGLVGAAMTMPDAHWGDGFPSGGVAAFDPDQGGVVSAGGVGFDISCGIRCLRTSLTCDDLAGSREALADALFHVIPAGVGQEGDLTLEPAKLDEVLTDGAVWAVRRRLVGGAGRHPRPADRPLR
jgi:tRNA-splicing ligase RtcB